MSSRVSASGGFLGLTQVILQAGATGAVPPPALVNSRFNRLRFTASRFSVTRFYATPS